MELIEICGWKLAAISDERKMAAGDSCVTFRADNPCFPCDGHNKNCAGYSGRMIEKTKLPEEYNGN